MSGAEVREPLVCTSQMQASLLHHLLFGPTLSGQGEEEEEGGRDGDAKDDLSPGDCHHTARGEREVQAEAGALSAGMGLLQLQGFECVKWRAMWSGRMHFWLRPTSPAATTTTSGWNILHHPAPLHCFQGHSERQV
ncbi:unnamed protein product [Pleuronectes platessa]|uniref:Uncharacterized protein n=1 Tax=Pleuronectes platessa TaxID=8262 RepID=A0A9N7YIJ7_PLEPL|nr:unnamed protein product [Pleuronectes platessa]